MFEKKTRNGVPFFTSTILPIPHAFSTRLGGVSSLPHLQSMNLGENRGDEPQNVQKNFDLLCQASGLPRKVVSGLQIHSEKLLYAEDSFEEKPSCDGFYTDRQGLSLCVKVADCLPVLLYEPEANCIAALHAGWRGSARNIVGGGVKALLSLGARKEKILAAVGAGISACCFAVRQDFVDEYCALVGGELSKRTLISKEGQMHADLKELNRLLLLQAGVTEEHLDVCPLCTCCQPDLFFSHRASGGLRGTMAALIALP